MTLELLVPVIAIATLLAILMHILVRRSARRRARASEPPAEEWPAELTETAAEEAGAAESAEPESAETVVAEETQLEAALYEAGTSEAEPELEPEAETYREEEPEPETEPLVSVQPASTPEPTREPTPEPTPEPDPAAESGPNVEPESLPRVDSISPNSSEEKIDAAFLSELEMLCMAADDLPSALAKAADTVRSRWDAPAAAIWTMSPSDATEDSGMVFHSVSVHHDAGLMAEEAREKISLPELFQPWSDALQKGEAVCIPDTAAEPDLNGRIRPRAGSLALVPLPCTTTTMAVLVVAWPGPLAVRAEQVADMGSLASALGRVTERFALRHELEYRRTQDRVFLRVAGALAHAPDLDVTLKSIVATVKEALGYQNCAILLVDDEEKELYVSSQVGYRESVDSLRLPLDGPSITATAARERSTQNVPDVSNWSGYVSGSEDIHSEIAFPLIVEDRVLGVLDIESVEENAFGEAAQKTLEAVAADAALVLSHSRLLTRLEKRASQLLSVDRLARSVSETIEPEQILKSVVDEVRGAVECDCAIVLRFDEEEKTCRMVTCAGDLADDLAEQCDVEFKVDWKAETEALGSESSYLADIDSGESELSRWLETQGASSVYRIPVRIEDRVQGVVLAVSGSPHAFSPAQLSVLRALSPHVSAAARNAHLYEELQDSYGKLNVAHEELVRAEQFRALGEMTSGLAHKFNNLLGAILGRVQVAIRRAEGDLLADLHVIEGSAQEGAATIRQLQRFAGLHEDREFEPVDLSAIVHQVLAGCPTEWQPGTEDEDKTHVARLLLNEEAWVKGIPQELEEVVKHTVANAIEAMPGGGVLTIEASLYDGKVILEVSDSGPGMSDEARDRVFHPFFTTKGPRNLGLGLSIAFGIVQRHDGSLDVESKSGEGTTVRLVLPASNPGEPELVATSESADTTRGGKILIVEDEPAVADLIGEILSGAGYEVSMVNGAIDAVQALAEDDFDLLLTDLGMPQMNGWELARHCRDLHPGMPVILVTGWGLEIDSAMVTESGVFSVLAKPFDVADILAAVSQALAADSQKPEAA
jgi:signal transduction histidine kinase/CheY-like chemotaxis protein/putative methionine-R-sulfoxide reductase with GAF domain